VNGSDSPHHNANKTHDDLVQSHEEVVHDPRLLPQLTNDQTKRHAENDYTCREGKYNPWSFKFNTDRFI